MVWISKVAVISSIIAAASATVTVNFKSSIDPSNIPLPSIAQATSTDPTAECVSYTAPELNFASYKWPTSWETASGTAMAAVDPAFKTALTSANLANAPKISVRTLTAAKGLNMSGYNTATDPDCWWSATQCMTPKHTESGPINADIFECPEPETWGLTFDDGPNCSHNAFYDFLQQNNQKASMFYIGSNVYDWPYGAQRGVRDGHHISVHTWSHQLMTTLSNEDVFAELYYTMQAIKVVTGVTPRYWRPAQGDIDDRVRWVATQLGLTAIIWNLDTDDWAAGVVQGVTQQTVQQNYDNFITMGTNGSFTNDGNIVLSHEINNMTMTFAMNNYAKVRSAYKHVVDVATCMNISQPYFESTPTFQNFAQYLSGSPAGSSSGATPAGSSSKNGNSGASLSVNSFSVIGMAILGLLVLA